MNSAEFKRHLFLANKDELIEKSFSSNHFNLCPIDGLINMCRARGDRSPIMDSEDYSKLRSAHVISFSGMSEELIAELRRCCESVCWMVEQTFSPELKVSNIWNLWGLMR